MNRRSLLLGVCLVCFSVACEFPDGEPEFQTSQNIEVPILAEKEFIFLGEGDDVIIDTTSTEFDSLFVVDPTTSAISLSRTEDFDFGDLDDAIPVVAVDPNTINAEVGELSLGSFSSQGAGGNLGQASFQAITGTDPALVPAGTTLPPGGFNSPTVNVGVDTDYFVSATIKSGSLRIEIENSLGFDLDVLTLGFNAGTTNLGSFNFNNVNHGTTVAQTITFTEGDVIQDINIDIDASWTGSQVTQANPDGITVTDVSGQSLTASQIVAAVEPQDFTFRDSTFFDDSEFRFEDETNFVELAEGQIVFQNFRNDIGIGINFLEIKFPGIILPDNFGNYTDTLILTFNDIPANSDINAPVEDLSEARITAVNNQIQYQIRAATVNTQQGAGSAPVTITENDQVNATVAIENIVLNRVVGVVTQREVLLNDDEFEDSILDLANDLEAEITEIDGLNDLSEQIEGLEFTDPSLTIIYDTNLGIDTDIIGAFVGINGKGEEVFLTGNPGSALEVAPTDPISGLLYNGVQLNANQLIKFEIQPSAGGITTNEVVFDPLTTNVADFLNNLPSEIRFIGKAAINPDELTGVVGVPVVFDPIISIDLPIALATPMAATFSDTVEADLKDLPDDTDDTRVTGATVYVNYENGLPFGIDLNLVFLDANDDTVTIAPLPGEQVNMIAAQVDPVTRFVTVPAIDALTFRLNEEQFRQLNNTRNVFLDAALVTTNNEEIRLRATDKVTVGISISASVSANVGGN